MRWKQGVQGTVFSKYSNFVNLSFCCPLSVPTSTREIFGWIRNLSHDLGSLLDSFRKTSWSSRLVLYREVMLTVVVVEFLANALWVDAGHKMDECIVRWIKECCCWERTRRSLEMKLDGGGCHQVKVNLLGHRVNRSSHDQKLPVKHSRRMYSTGKRSLELT